MNEHSGEDAADPFVLDEDALRAFLVVAPWWGMWNGKGWRLAHPLRVAHDLAQIGRDAR